MTEFEVVSGRKDGVDLVLIYRHEVIFRSAIWIRKKIILHQNKIYWTRVTEIGIFTETSNGEHNAFTKLKRNCIIHLIESVLFVGDKNVVVTEDCDCELLIARDRAEGGAGGEMESLLYLVSKLCIIFATFF